MSDSIKSSEEIAAMELVNRDAYYISEASTVQYPFLLIAAFIGLLVVFFLFTKLPKLLHDSPRDGYGKLFKNKLVMMGALGIFVYVGAEVAIGSYLVNYFLDMNLVAVITESEMMSSLVQLLLNTELSLLDGKAIVGAFVVFYWSGAMVGRFIGAYLTKIIAPTKVLLIFSSLAIVMILISINSQGLVAMWSILAVGLFNSIMFPTIFTLTLDGLGDLKPQASGLLCTAIVGGAIIPPLYGFLTDEIGFKLALILIVICYGYILYFAFKKQKARDLQTS